MRWFARRACLTLLVLSYTPALAEEAPPPPHIKTQITTVFTGWNDDLFGIITVDPVVDPAGCNPGPTIHGYAADSTQPNYHTLYAVALLAFAERATVVVVVDPRKGSCVVDRPKLMGLNILRDD